MNTSKSPESSEKRRAELAALLGAFVVAGMAGCAAAPPPPEPLRPVRSEIVFASGGGRERSFTGNARAGQEIDLSFRVPGRIDSLPARVGAAVKAGTILASLEPDDFEIAVRQAEAALEQARAAAQNAESDLERVRGLFESRSASREQYDAVLARSRSANAQVEVAVQSLNQHLRQREYATLRAPVDGSIASVSPEVNENVQQGQRVVRMTAGVLPEVEVGIPGVLISDVRDGDEVTVTFPALPGETFSATVTEVGVATTVGGTTFPVKVVLARGGDRIRSGMTAEVTFRFEDQDNREHIYLPTFAVGEDRDGRFVFVVEPAADGTESAFVRRTDVEVASRLSPGGRIEVLQGLREGQQVVTAGVRRLTDGQRVKLLGVGSDP